MEMKKYKLGEIADIIVGYPFESAKFNTDGNGVLLVRGMNVSERFLRFGDEARYWDYITDDLKPYYLKENDIVIGMDGSKVGKNFALVKKENLPLLLVQRVACVRAKKDYDQRYIWQYVSSKRFIEYVNTIKTGSSIPHISGNQIANFPIFVPDSKAQKKIADVLSSLDDKIALNRRMNEKLEQMAKRLYDHWFVQFDFPNAGGKPYKASGGKMVWNETLKRKIPAGWEVKKLETLFTTNRGVSYSTKTITGDKGIPMINLASFSPDGSYKIDGIKIYTGEYTNEKVLKPFDLVMCNTQQTAIDFSKDIIGKALLVPDIFEGDITSSHHVNTLKVHDDKLKFYLYRLFNTNYFHAYISHYASGTNIMGLDFTGVENYSAVIPSKEVLSKFADFTLNIEKKKSEIIRENKKLIVLRDRLLPLLMNGQVIIN
ncbi:MAG: restriction endonuclease subunit S [Treponema sp.]|nr:restriction endonuclease subunit S [Treponema sp.]